MRKGLLFFLIFPLLILGAYSLIRSYQPSLLNFLIGRDVADSSVQKSTFSSYTEYVTDKDLGLYPGEKKVNKGSEEFLEYVNDSTKASQIFTVYRMFIVEKVEDARSGKFTLTDEGKRATYLFECSVDRTSAHKFTNLQFISSGFDFNSTAVQGDSVFTKCKNEECTILGPDCIIIKKEL